MSKNLIGVRTSYKGSLTKWFNYVAKMDEKNVARADYESWSEKIKELTAKLEANHTEICGSVTNQADIDDAVADYDGTLDKILDLGSILNRIQEHIKEREEQKALKQRTADIIATANAQAAAQPANTAS
ncbi:unnamed protein product, partial [Allacma fusca]